MFYNWLFWKLVDFGFILAIECHRAYTIMATNHDGLKVYHDGHSFENVKTNGVLRQIHGKFPVLPSSENMFVTVMVCRTRAFVLFCQITMFKHIMQL